MAHKRNEGFDTGPMSLPKMDRPSVAFAWFLDSIAIEDRNPGGEFDPVLTCRLCSEYICDIDDGDPLRVLLNTALAHTC